MPTRTPTAPESESAVPDDDAPEPVALAEPLAEPLAPVALAVPDALLPVSDEDELPPSSAPKVPPTSELPEGEDEVVSSAADW